MNVTVVKYNAGNIHSVLNALERLGITPLYTDDPEQLKSADKVIFPGQGEAKSAMRYLKNLGLDRTIKELKQPVLGVCIGLQLLCNHSEEGDTPCLGVFDLQVKRFSPGKKVPHMGWNTIEHLKSPLFEGINEESFLYYVHSYYAELGEHTIGSTTYGESFSAALHRDNFYAVQAHPEKSSKTGEQILKNFLAL